MICHCSNENVSNKKVQLRRAICLMQIKFSQSLWQEILIRNDVVSKILRAKTKSIQSVQEKGFQTYKVDSTHCTE